MSRIREHVGSRRDVNRSGLASFNLKGSIKRGGKGGEGGKRSWSGGDRFDGISGLAPGPPAPRPPDPHGFYGIVRRVLQPDDITDFTILAVPFFEKGKFGVRASIPPRTRRASDRVRGNLPRL